MLKHTGSWDELYIQSQQLLRDIPVLAANKAENFFTNSFRQQGFSGQTQQQWKKRKNDKDPGRAVLVKSGKLRRGFKKQTGPLFAKVGNYLPYAEAHNAGSREIVQVKEHNRSRSQRFKTRQSSLKTRRASTRTQRIVTGNYTVKSHSRQMNLPKRQFMGDSPFLMLQIERIFKSRIIQITK